MNDGLGPQGSYFEAKARKEAQERQKKEDALYPLGITVLYLILGFVFDAWHPGWLLFLTIPLHYMRWNLLANPVLVTLIYLIMGCFFNLWHPGWMIFLIIPFAHVLGKK